MISSKKLIPSKLKKLPDYTRPPLTVCLKIPIVKLFENVPMIVGNEIMTSINIQLEKQEHKWNITKYWV